MASKKKSSTSKGKKSSQGSRSDKAADQITSEGASFITFDALTQQGSGGGGGYYVPSMETTRDDIPDTLSPKLRNSMRQMTKKDPKTRQKALKEFCKIIDNNSEEEILTVLPFWPRIYKLLATDLEVRIREQCHLANSSLAKRAGKNLESSLLAILGPWVCGIRDPYPPASTAAENAFNSIFRHDKAVKALSFGLNQIIEHAMENIVITSSQTLVSIGNLTQDEAQQKYECLLCVGLGGLEYTLMRLDESDIKHHSEKLLSLTQEKQLWKLAQDETNITVSLALFSFYSTYFKQLGSYFPPDTSQNLAKIIFPSIFQTNYVTLPTKVQSILSLMHYANKWYDEEDNKPDLHEHFLPPLWHMFSEAACCVAYKCYPSLLPMLACFPKILLTDDDVMKRFFDNCLGSFEKGYKNHIGEGLTTLDTYFECSRYILTIQDVSDNVKSHLKESFIKILEDSITGSHLFPAVDNQIKFSVYKSIIQLCMEKNSDVVRYFDPDLFTNQVINSILTIAKRPSSDEKTHKTITQNILYIYQSLKNRITIQNTKKQDPKVKTTFDLSMSEESTETELNLYILDILLNFAIRLCNIWMLKSLQLPKECGKICLQASGRSLLILETYCKKELVKYSLMALQGHNNVFSPACLKYLDRPISDLFNHINKNPFQLAAVIFYQEFNSLLQQPTSTESQGISEDLKRNYIIITLCLYIKILSLKKVSIWPEAENTIDFLTKICKRSDLPNMLDTLMNILGPQKRELFNIAISLCNSETLDWLICPHYIEIVEEKDINTITKEEWTHLERFLKFETANLQIRVTVLNSLIKSFIEQLEYSTQELETYIRFIQLIQALLLRFQDMKTFALNSELHDLVLATFKFAVDNNRNSDQKLFVRIFKMFYIQQELFSDCYEYLLEYLFSSKNEICSRDPSFLIQGYTLLEIAIKALDEDCTVFVYKVPGVDPIEIWDKHKQKMAALMAGTLKITLSDVYCYPDQWYALGELMLPPELEIQTERKNSKSRANDINLVDFCIGWSLMWLDRRSKLLRDLAEKSTISELDVSDLNPRRGKIIYDTAIGDHDDEELEELKAELNAEPESLNKSDLYESYLFIMWCAEYCSLVGGQISSVYPQVAKTLQEIIPSKFLTQVNIEAMLEICASRVQHNRSLWTFVLINLIHLTSEEKWNETALKYFHSLHSNSIQLVLQHFPSLHLEQGYEMALETLRDAFLIKEPAKLANELIKCNIWFSMTLDEFKSDLVTLTFKLARHFRDERPNYFIFNTADSLPNGAYSLNISMMSLIHSIIVSVPEQLEEDDWDIVFLSAVQGAQYALERINQVELFMENLPLQCFTCNSLRMVSTVTNSMNLLPPGPIKENWSKCFLQPILDNVHSTCPILSGWDAIENYEHLPVWPSLLEDISKMYEDMNSELYSFNKLLEILSCEEIPIQVAVHKLGLRQLLASLDDIRKGTENAISNFQSKLTCLTGQCREHLSNLLSQSGQQFDVNFDPMAILNEDSLLKPYHRCLLIWLLLFELTKYSNETKMTDCGKQIVEALKETTHYEIMIILLAVHVEHVHNAATINDVTMNRNVSSFILNDTLYLSGYVFYNYLLSFPATIRRWCSNLQERALHTMITKTIVRFSQRLIDYELATVKVGIVGNIDIRIKNNDVIVIYTIANDSEDYNTSKLVLRFPPDFPLESVIIEGDKLFGVSIPVWRRWLLEMNIILMNQNCSIMEAIENWRKHLNDHLGDTSKECTICFSFIHVKEKTLPKKECKTCGNRFHAVCINEWFSKSGNTACPMCRNAFN